MPHVVVGVTRGSRTKHRTEDRLAPAIKGGRYLGALVAVDPVRNSQIVLQIPPQVLQLAVV